MILLILRLKNAGKTEYTVGKKKFTSAGSVKKNISNKMTYSVPSDFTKVESQIENIEGYQYKLNEIPSQYHTSAEDEEKSKHEFNNASFSVDYKRVQQRR